MLFKILNIDILSEFIKDCLHFEDCFEKFEILAAVYLSFHRKLGQKC